MKEEILEESRNPETAPVVDEQIEREKMDSIINTLDRDIERLHQ